MEIGAHDVHGALATVTVSGTKDAALQKKIDDLLAPFVLKHAVVWG